MSASQVGSGPRLSGRRWRLGPVSRPAPRAGGQSSWPESLAGRWIPLSLAGAGIVILLWDLTLQLNVAPRGDELTSLFRYSSEGPGGIWGTYIPNDHMLYELLTWALRGLTGDRSVAVMRFWAVMPALAAALVMTAWAWRRLDPWVAALSALLLAASPVFVDLSAEGRGYGLSFLAAVVMLIGADWAARRGTRGGLAVFAAGALAGIWTLPVFGPFFVALAGLLLAKLGRRRAVVVSIGAVLLASAIWYAPVLGGLIHASKMGHGQQLSAAGFITRPLKDMLQPSVQALIHPLSPQSAGVFRAHLLSYQAAPSVFEAELIAAIAVTAATVVLVLRIERFLAAALVLPPIFTYLVLEVLRDHLIARFAGFVVPGLLLLWAAGLVGLGRAAARTPVLRALAVAGGVTLSLFVAWKAYRLATLDGRPEPQELISNQPSAFASYFSTDDVTAVSPPQLQTLACNPRDSFVLLEYQVSPNSAQTATCLQRRRYSTTVVLRFNTPRGPVLGLVLDVPPAS